MIVIFCCNSTFYNLKCMYAGTPGSEGRPRQKQEERESRVAALLLKAEMNLWCYGLPVISTCSYLANYSTELLICGFVHTKTADYFKGNVHYIGFLEDTDLGKLPHFRFIS